MNIRQIEEKDAEKFLKLLKRLDNETKYMLFEPDERTSSIGEIKDHITKLLKSKSMIFVAENNQGFAGYILANRGTLQRIKHSAYIVIGILQASTGKGIGQMLFERMERWASKQQISRLELTVMTHNDKAIKLYEKMGFEKEGVKRHSLIIDGTSIDEYYMSKLL
ncbi:GNAT family N-acetyltransferase [Chengkuizengella axinellae]|uniref:GNAT family N-acetyltransferase n=1 Tax=Chengkuizengella axinellae TaxID=3064388 RepID=A0ABT9J4C2_9BACL|nr:GNAT family N-acetyltransferase [Chengkuizengella sp. 2205SS18-9]MDP5276491.1 GNAT family N-acetyltransferase [Chengkuizengella sp. 2205SS18-9]